MLTETQWPYTGAYFGPADSRGPDKGPTAIALKRMLKRLGRFEGEFEDFDEHYNQQLQSQFADWQRDSGIIPASGNYGKASWEKARATKLVEGPHAGEYAMDGYGLALIRNEALTKQTVKLCYPFPVGEGGGVCQGLHPTAGLPGNWAIDFCDTPGARVLAVEAGKIQKLSGHPPSDDTADAMGVFGWSTYIRTPIGYVYFITHLGSRTPGLRVGSKVEAGDAIGRVGDQDFRPDHAHVGVTSPLGQDDARRKILLVANAPRVKL